MADPNRIIERNTVVETKSSGSTTFILGGLVVAVAVLGMLFYNGTLGGTGGGASAPDSTTNTNVTIEAPAAEPAPAPAPAEPAPAPAEPAPKVAP